MAPSYSNVTQAGRFYQCFLAVSLMLLLVSCLMSAGCRVSVTTIVHVDSDDIIASPDVLREYAETRRYGAGKPRSIKITPDGRFVLFLRSPATSSVHDLYVLDTETGEESRLLTAQDILGSADENLSVEEKARRERMRITSSGIVSFDLSNDGKSILVPLSGRLFVVSLGTKKVNEVSSDHGFPIDPKFSPDGEYLSCVRDNEVYVVELNSGIERKLTSGSDATVTNGVSEFVAQEEMSRHSGYWWSPDSSQIVYQQTDHAGLETMFIADALHPEKAPQSWFYPRPGKKNADVKLGIMPVSGGSTTWINWDRTKYPYLATVRWSANAPLTILVQNRRQTEQRLLRVDPITGDTTTLLVENDDAWINLEQKMPAWLPDGSRFLWMTERRGAWQLELRKSDGSLECELTPTEMGLSGFVAADVQGNKLSVWLTGSTNPTEEHVYHLEHTLGENSEPSIEAITREPGVHTFKLSTNTATRIHVAALADGQAFQRVLSQDGSIIGEIESTSKRPPFVPNVEFTTTGRSPEFHAAIVRPRNFDCHRKYPVIVYVYGGPHARVVRSSPMRYFRQQWLADHGFVVVCFDGRGTPGRGREWERAIKGDLIKKPLEDQANALQSLGRDYPELDLSRVGIYGWSFGGYFSAMAVLLEPETYHCGIAGAPVTDWYDYDTHYTERYMDLPSLNEDGYRDTSAITYADRLRRPLLLIHGSADDNVYFKHSLNLSKALFKAGKQHDMLVLSGYTHMVSGPNATPNLYARMAEYFIEHVK